MLKRNAATGVVAAAIFVLGAMLLAAVSASNTDEAIREQVLGNEGSAVSQPQSARAVTENGSDDARGDPRNPSEFLGHTWTADAGNKKLIRVPNDQLACSSTNSA